MVRKNWIAAVCVIVVAAMVYAEKGKMKETLPAAVESAVKAMFPSAAIEKSKMEEMEIKTYEVELKGASMNVAADGMVASVETVEEVNALPAAVAQTIKAQGVKVAKVEKEVQYAELKLVKLDVPMTTYEAKISKDGKEMEIKIAADGKILKQEVEKKDKDDDDKD
jgi:hypothetical protein